MNTMMQPDSCGRCGSADFDVVDQDTFKSQAVAQAPSNMFKAGSLR